MKNSHHGPDEYLSTISLTINKNPSQLGAKASEGGPFPLHHPVSPDLPAWPPAAAVAPVLLRNFAGGRHCDLQGPRARCDRESMGTCWKMLENDDKLRVWSGIWGRMRFFRRGHMGRRAYFFKDSWFCSWWLIVFGGGDGRWMSTGRCLFLLHQLCFFALSNIEIVSKNIRQCTEIYQALRWKCLKHGSWSWSNYRGLDNCKDLVWLVVWNSFYFSIYWE